jgi:signal transduction histidine kinase
MLVGVFDRIAMTRLSLVTRPPGRKGARMANETAGWLGRAIQEGHLEIERRWLERVQRDVVRKPGLGLTQLRDGIPDYLQALARLLTSAQRPSEHAAARAWQEVAREHGVTRVRIGFDISQLVHEFIVLRHVIREVAAERGQPPAECEPILADLFDAAISAAVQSYTDARDYEARRHEAENIGFLTHELRNPLATALLGVGQLRKQDRGADPVVLDRMEKSLRSMDELISGVLLTEKLEVGARPAQNVTIQLGPLVDGAVEAARRIAEQKGLTFHLAHEPDLVVHVDPELTRSALQNLADNAAKYTDEGEVDVAISAEESALVIDVHDTCHGLSPEELNTIFEPFRRGRTHQAGTGLGLAIARRAVEAQGGAITAESSGTFGCHFSIRLPRALAPRERRRRSG